MNILVALDSNYVYPLCVMFNSLAKTNQGREFDIYVAYSNLTDNDFKKMEKALSGVKATIHKVLVSDGIFADAPVLDRLSKETYYRLLIGEILPQDVDKILYLDPDIVVNKDLADFYNIDLEGKIVAGGTHLYGITQSVNLSRLKMKKSSCYINAGVLLINLKEWRKSIALKEILSFISQNIKKLLLADQDVINVLFEDKTLCIDERIYNLDEKTFKKFTSKFAGKKRIDLDWVRKNTVIIHFNGSKKPWKDKKYRGKLGEFFENNKNI